MYVRTNKQTNKQTIELKSRAETRVLFEVVDDQCKATNEEQGARFVDVTSGKETVDFAWGGLMPGNRRPWEGDNRCESWSWNELELEKVRGQRRDETGR